MLQSVTDRYSQGAKQKEAALCCPVNYDPQYLKIIPDEVIERDYGCGDPSPYVKEGETVLDLGSGGGKICFIASQIVGESGKVIGVDMTDDMLELAKRNQPIVAEKLGYSNIEFKHGYIQDLRTDLDLIDEYVKNRPIQSAKDYKELQHEIAALKKQKPLIPDNSIDVIVSNCVLNLVSDDQKKALFQEMFRVLKKGGRIAISDIVSDEVSPKHLKDDDHLWSGCISGALQEHEFLVLLEEVGFYGIAIDKFEYKPWQIVEGIEYRSAIITAYKGKQGACIEKNQAVIYKGPWKQVQDDDGHTYYRGKRMAVCEKTFNILNKAPYKNGIIPIEPHQAVEGEELFNCKRTAFRDPQETKQGMGKITVEVEESCGPGECC